jgi:hypothetical protein
MDSYQDFLAEIYWSRSLILSKLFFMNDILTLLHLPPLRCRCVGGCWDRTQDSCIYGIGCQTL